MQVYVNGEEKQVADSTSLAALLAQLELPTSRIAVEVNRTVVRRANWSDTLLSDDDHIEIVYFVGGG